MDRHSETSFGSPVRAALDALDARISYFGWFGSVVILTGMAALTVVALHLTVCRLEGLAVRPVSVINLALEIMLVAGPIIFYARQVIAELKTTRTEIDDLSRQLTISIEQAHQSNRAKSSFLANMSHELRTPLNAILGFSEVMKEQHLGPMTNPRYLAYAGDILASGNHLLGIINDILDLSKIEAGKMTVENAEEFPLRKPVEDSLAICASLAERSGVHIECQLPPETVRILAVERLIRQIMINLLGNAIKFTPAGGKVQLSGRLNGCGGYTITILDSGIGMSEQDIAKSLMPFGQVNNKLTATHTGTGLGLPLAKAMLELHDGRLEITSTPGTGTRMLLRFPPTRINAGPKVAAA